MLISSIKMDPLTVIGGVASIAGLLSESINLIQRIQQGIKNVSDGPKVLQVQADALETLRAYLQRVLAEETLQTAAVEDSVQKVRDICGDLEMLLNKMIAAQSKSRSKQLVLSLLREDGKERELRNISEKLNTTRLQLAMNIELVHVGITGSMERELEVVVSEIKRANIAVESVVQEALRIATLLEHRGEQGTGMGIAFFSALIYKTDRDITGRKEGRITWCNNMSFGQAKQLNGALGEPVEMTQNGRWEDNKAHGQSWQVNGSISQEAGMGFFNSK
jgi:hypothetical protein